MSPPTAKSLGIRPDIFAVMTSAEVERYALLRARWKEAVAIRQPLIINHFLGRGDAEEEAAIKAAEDEINATEEEMWGFRADALQRTFTDPPLSTPSASPPPQPLAPPPQPAPPAPTVAPEAASQATPAPRSHPQA